MMRSLRSRAIGLAMVPMLLGFGLAGPALAQTPGADSPRISVSAGATNGWFDVRVTNIDRNEELQYILTGPRQELVGGRQHTASSDGTLDFNFKLPRSAQAGMWTITVDGSENDEIVGTFTAQAQPSDLDLTISQATDATGTSLTISNNEGFEPTEQATYWLTAPDGSLAQSGVADVSDGGRISIAVSIPSNAPRGLWMVHVYGQDSDHLGVASVTIR